MKRSEALAPLSRDHQHALDAALRLRRADESSLGAAVDHFRSFFEREGRRHFDIEERVLVPALALEDPEWSNGVRRLRAEHAAIREQASELSGAPHELDAARALGNQLDDHVRFEERVLFVLLEQRLTAAELQELGAAIAAAEADAP
jgi:hemerythrin-like domain-containing protein